MCVEPIWGYSLGTARAGGRLLLGWVVGCVWGLEFDAPDPSSVGLCDDAVPSVEMDLFTSFGDFSGSLNDEASNGVDVFALKMRS